jgi:hypothetical protein
MRGGGWRSGAEQELKTTKHGAPTGMKQTEGTNAMQAAERHMLEKAAQELVGGQGHRLATSISAVAIVEGHGAVVAGQDGLVGEGGTVDVATEVVEHGGGPSDGLGEDDPALVPWDPWEPRGGIPWGPPALDNHAPSLRSVTCLRVIASRYADTQYGSWPMKWDHLA